MTKARLSQEEATTKALEQDLRMYGNCFSTFFYLPKGDAVCVRIPCCEIAIQFDDSGSRYYWKHAIRPDETQPNYLPNAIWKAWQKGEAYLFESGIVRRNL